MSVELIRAPAPWHSDPQQLAELWRWLDEQGRTPDDPAYFMERAEKWTPHFEDMCAEQREQERERLYEEDRAMESERRYAP
jgi:hypothetical protein